jgi:hypothetical protein
MLKHKSTIPIITFLHNSINKSKLCTFGLHHDWSLSATESHPKNSIIMPYIATPVFFNSKKGIISRYYLGSRMMCFMLSHLTLQLPTKRAKPPRDGRWPFCQYLFTHFVWLRSQNRDFYIDR